MAFPSMQFVEFSQHKRLWQW